MFRKCAPINTRVHHRFVQLHGSCTVRSTNIYRNFLIPTVAAGQNADVSRENTEIFKIHPWNTVNQSVKYPGKRDPYGDFVKLTDFPHKSGDDAGAPPGGLRIAQRFVGKIR
jgi:hypothetical protein